jgi:hypothetical protein
MSRLDACFQGCHQTALPGNNAEAGGAARVKDKSLKKVRGSQVDSTLVMRYLKRHGPTTGGTAKTPRSEEQLRRWLIDYGERWVSISLFGPAEERLKSYKTKA